MSLLNMGKRNGHKNPVATIGTRGPPQLDDFDTYSSDCGDNVFYDDPTFDMSPNPKKKRVGSSKNVSQPCSTLIASSVPNSCPPARQRQTANARERDRTHSVNSAFTTLRTLIPTEPADRKLSKIETLRLASSYISHLGTILMSGADLRDQPCLRHPFLYNGDSGGARPVCTFCLSGMKKAVSCSKFITYVQYFMKVQLHDLV